jgi:hypothetical protein
MAENQKLADRLTEKLQHDITKVTDCLLVERRNKTRNTRTVK